MKITGVDTILAGGRYLFLRVNTDSGICGYGECGAWGYQEATAETVKQMSYAIVGQDPFRIEHIWNSLQRCLHFRGSVIQAAISGIDIALWDLKGKALGVPCYELLGGKTRNKIRIYVNAVGKTDQEVAENAARLKAAGFNAVRYNLVHGPQEDGGCKELHSVLIENNVRRIATVRDAVGWDMDIAIEAHRGMKLSDAIELGKAIEEYRPLFLEDPIPDNLEAMVKVIEGCHVPVATGERFIEPKEFDQLIRRSSVRYIRPDMCVAGGITAGKKIAAIGECAGVNLIPHNPLGPISTAACLQLIASIPNFEIQEYPMINGKCRLDAEMKEPFEIKNGYVMIPEGPGLGIELIDDIAEVFPFQGSYGRFCLDTDGSVVDR